METNMTAVKRDNQGEKWEVELKGEIDLYNADELKEEISVISEGNVDVACEELEYIDSTGIGILVSQFKKLKDQGFTIRIHGLKPHLYRIFILTNLQTFFDIEEAK